MALKPTYDHDCEQCEFLGKTYWELGEKFVDLYYCKSSYGHRIIIRKSSDGPDYESHHISGATVCPITALALAWKLSKSGPLEQVTILRNL